MRSTMILFSLLLVVVLLPACMQKEPDMASLKKTVDDFNNASVHAMLYGTSDAVMAFYPDDAMWFGPNMVAVKGKVAIKAQMEKMGQAGPKMTSAAFTTTELKAAGTIAYELGTYDMAFDIPGVGPVKDNGKYIAIWHQQQNGSWKVYNQMWNSDMPAMPMPDTKKDQKGGKK